MASQEELPLIVFNTNYADVVVDIGKVVLGESARKKTSLNQKRQRRDLSIAVCALLNSGGGIVRMQSEDRNYCFQEHGIGLDIETTLRDCIGGNETCEYFQWMQEGSNLLLFVKTWSCGGLEQGSAAATKPRLCSLSTGLFGRSGTSVFPVKSREAPGFLKEKENSAKCHSENGLSIKRALLSSFFRANETPLNIQEHDIQNAAARFIRRDKVLAGEVLGFRETTHIEFKEYSTKNILDYISKNLPKYVSAFANTQGGYLFFGVDDNGKVTATHSDVEKEALEQTVAKTILSLSVYHSCGSEALGVYLLMYHLLRQHLGFSGSFSGLHPAQKSAHPMVLSSGSAHRVCVPDSSASRDPPKGSPCTGCFSPIPVWSAGLGIAPSLLLQECFAEDKFKYCRRAP